MYVEIFNLYFVLITTTTRLSTTYLCTVCSTEASDDIEYWKVIAETKGKKKLRYPSFREARIDDNYDDKEIRT